MILKRITGWGQTWPSDDKEKKDEEDDWGGLGNLADMMPDEDEPPAPPPPPGGTFGGFGKASRLGGGRAPPSPSFNNGGPPGMGNFGGGGGMFFGSAPSPGGGYGKPPGPSTSPVNLKNVLTGAMGANNPRMGGGGLGGGLGGMGGGGMGGGMNAYPSAYGAASTSPQNGFASFGGPAAMPSPRVGSAFRSRDDDRPAVVDLFPDPSAPAPPPPANDRFGKFGGKKKQQQETSTKKKGKGKSKWDEPEEPEDSQPVDAWGTKPSNAWGDNNEEDTWDAPAPAAGGGGGWGEETNNNTYNDWGAGGGDDTGLPGGGRFDDEPEEDLYKPKHQRKNSNQFPEPTQPQGKKKGKKKGKQKQEEQEQADDHWGTGIGMSEAKVEEDTWGTSNRKENSWGEDLGGGGLNDGDDGGWKGGGGGGGGGFGLGAGGGKAWSPVAGLQGPEPIRSFPTFTTTTKFDPTKMTGSRDFGSAILLDGGVDRKNAAAVRIEESGGKGIEAASHALFGVHRVADQRFMWTAPVRTIAYYSLANT